MDQNKEVEIKNQKRHVSVVSTVSAVTIQNMWRENQKRHVSVVSTVSTVSPVSPVTIQNMWRRHPKRHVSAWRRWKSIAERKNIRFVQYIFVQKVDA